MFLDKKGLHLKISEPNLHLSARYLKKVNDREFLREMKEALMMCDSLGTAQNFHAHALINKRIKELQNAFLFIMSEV